MKDKQGAKQVWYRNFNNLQAQDTYCPDKCPVAPRQQEGGEQYATAPKKNVDQVVSHPPIVIGVIAEFTNV